MLSPKPTKQPAPVHPTALELKENRGKASWQDSEHPNGGQPSGQPQWSEKCEGRGEEVPSQAHAGGAQKIGREVYAMKHEALILMTMPRCGPWCCWCRCWVFGGGAGRGGSAPVGGDELNISEGGGAVPHHAGTTMTINSFFSVC